MNYKDNIEWLKSLKQQIGKTQHRDLWHFEQVIDETIENLKPLAKPLLIYSAGYCAGLAGDKITEIIITHWSCKKMKAYLVHDKNRAEPYYTVVFAENATKQDT